jgi:hypothetical protein
LSELFYRLVLKQWTFLEVLSIAFVCYDGVGNDKSVNIFANDAKEHPIAMVLNSELWHRSKLLGARFVHLDPIEHGWDLNRGNSFEHDVDLGRVSLTLGAAQQQSAVASGVRPQLESTWEG